MLNSSPEGLVNPTNYQIVAREGLTKDLKNGGNLYCRLAALHTWDICLPI